MPCSRRTLRNCLRISTTARVAPYREIRITFASVVREGFRDMGTFEGYYMRCGGRTLQNTSRISTTTRVAAFRGNGITFASEVHEGFLDTSTFVGWYYALWSLHVSKFRKYLDSGKSSGAKMGITFASEVRD